jgi:hypothetical protein
MKQRSDLILAQWERSVTRCDGVTTSAGGDAALGRGKGRDDANWDDMNFTGPKSEENTHGRFSWYKWTMKI